MTKKSARRKVFQKKIISIQNKKFDNKETRNLKYFLGKKKLKYFLLVRRVAIK